MNGSGKGGLTKMALARHMAEKLELTNKQAASFLDLLAETAIKETKKNGVFIIPGIGRLVKAERKARMGRNPQTGRSDQDQSQIRGEVPRGKDCKGRDRTPEEIVHSSSPKMHCPLRCRRQIQHK